eukprot:TRINITY_DN5500_c0_g1_i1.p3 TRINITY_DN5500_c0_g1~~TRINITY_DN5500_c0_g1_i1.p3  ORF type:complete len:133 (-),score=37.25 TRINITY_DN5500_c0_g1_i1:182-580(-)
MRSPPPSFGRRGWWLPLRGIPPLAFRGWRWRRRAATACPSSLLFFNNGGIYGGSGASGAGAWAADPAPTSFVPAARYEALATAFGGEGYYVEDPAVLRGVLDKALAARAPAVVNVRIDPAAGTESGRMTAHN